jgi:hypothetical protein
MLLRNLGESRPEMLGEAWRLIRCANFWGVGRSQDVRTCQYL